MNHLAGRINPPSRLEKNVFLFYQLDALHNHHIARFAHIAQISSILALFIKTTGQLEAILSLRRSFFAALLSVFVDKRQDVIQIDSFFSMPHLSGRFY